MRAESGQAGAAQAVGQGKKLGRLLRDLEPLEQLCDHNLTSAGGGVGDCPTWWAARTSPQRLQP